MDPSRAHIRRFLRSLLPEPYLRLVTRSGVPGRRSLTATCCRFYTYLGRTRNWPGADVTPALFLNQRGGRLSARGASDVVATLADAASQGDETTAHVLRHTFGTTLVRGGADLVLVAELMGHARLETTRAYTRPTAEDRAWAVELLPIDR